MNKGIGSTQTTYGLGFCFAVGYTPHGIPNAYYGSIGSSGLFITPYQGWQAEAEFSSCSFGLGLCLSW